MLTVPEYVAGSSYKLEEKYIRTKSSWRDKLIEQLTLDENTLIVMILRDGQKIIPDGKTIIKKGDVILMFRC